MNVKMSRVWRRTGAWGCAVALVAGGLTGCGHDKQGPGRNAAPPGLPLPAGAERHAVAAESYAPKLDVIGTTASAEMVHLSARLSAVVETVNVSAGQRVRRGDVLLTLDDRDIREQVLAAEAQLQQAEAERNRTRTLFETQSTTAQAQTAAESAYQAAKAQAERARVMLSYATVSSPIDGVITDRRLEVGDLASPGQVLVAVYDPVHMRVEAPVPLRLIDKLSLDQIVDVELERPAAHVQGRVAHIVGEVEPLSRTRLVKVDLGDGHGEILPGGFARLWVRDDARQAVLVPAAAVYPMGQLAIVRIVQGDRAIARAVRTGVRDGERVEILAGLNPGDVIMAHPEQAMTGADPTQGSNHHE